MNRRSVTLGIGAGCAILILLLVLVGSLVFPLVRTMAMPVRQVSQPELPAEEQQANEVLPTLTPAAQDGVEPPISSTVTTPPLPGLEAGSLAGLYERLNPGVVSIQVYIERETLGGAAAGSGFILDTEGHVVTNNHVIADATRVTVVFYDGTEAEAEVIGADAESDLAILRVEQLGQGAHPLPLADSDQVQVGEWVVAIGNPFELGGSMSVGIVSAVGRTIPTGSTPFVIPQAIQTDAAINPGNSGGPLLNLRGEVVGVNAQILSRSAMPANAGVGFAIPSNIVRRIAPTLIEHGAYQWPWLGVQGGDVSLTVMEANQLESQLGAYIADVVPNGPADEAGLQGSSGFQEVGGLEVPVGGDVVVEADGRPVADFADLLVTVASKNPGETIVLTILRDGQQQDVTVTLEPRPENVD
ncbi:MAG: trypsin-like peptidase domain-containing protein [Anaerolineae bacterium]|nr:trypsin-like peptidase domain-containing protein [Anaerolineae bacterium]